MNNYELKNVLATDSEGLARITSLIHDEEFQVDKIIASKESLIIPLKKIFNDRPQKLISRTFLFKKTEVEVLHAVIRINKFLNEEICDTEKIGTYTFDQINFDGLNSTLVLKACPGLIIKIRVSDVEVEYEEVGFNGKAYITDFIFMQKTNFVD